MKCQHNTCFDYDLKYIQHKVSLFCDSNWAVYKLINCIKRFFNLQKVKFATGNYSSTVVTWVRFFLSRSHDIIISLPP